jgi:hypothetical protein
MMDAARPPRARANLAVVAAAGTVLATITIITATTARADDDFAGARVIFARGSSLYQVDARGKGETEIAQLAAAPSPPATLRAKTPRGRSAGKPSSAPSPTVRALRCDAGGSVLLADLAGKWAWMPLDGSTKSLTELPCGDGPAQLTEDGSAVMCRSVSAPSQSIIVELDGPAGAQPRIVTVDVPSSTVRLIGSGAERKLVWADASGVWTAAPGELRNKARAAADAPLRGFLPSPDGERAVGVYADQIFAGVHRTQSAEVLMTVALDGRGARRKAIRDGVAVEWSHDGRWVLVQDSASTCIMRATGGQYKCWRGYTASSLSSDGRWALALGNRDGSKRQKPARSARSTGKPAAKAAPPRHPPPRIDDDLVSKGEDKPWDHIDEPSDEPESGEPPPPIDDVSVAPPSGPLSLYRMRLEGAFTDRPTLLVKVVDGAAVWVPGSP